MAKEEQKQSTLGTPMPSNAAGPWRKWPEEKPSQNGWFLLYDGEFAFATTARYHQGRWFLMKGTSRGTEITSQCNFWAEILPPEARGE